MTKFHNVSSLDNLRVVGPENRGYATENRLTTELRSAIMIDGKERKLF
jgi:hypothetical protein